MKEPTEAPGSRFWAWLSAWLLAGCAGYAALVLSTASWPEVGALRHFYASWRPRPGTEAEFGAVRAGLAGLAAAAGLLGLALGRGPVGRAERGALARELAGAGRGLARGWGRLAPAQRRWAGGVLLGLTALRTYYSFHTQPYDDAISFEVFVRARLLALSACYPMPNNHVLSNTVAWGFYQLYPGFWWSMRLPVLLLSTAGSVLWGLGLLRWANFRVALGAGAGFGLLQLSLYHATVGRGYWLLIDLAAVGFFSTLVLTRTPTEAGAAPAPYRRAAWLGLGLAGVLGLYTVPTFAYFLASAYGWLGLRAARRRAWAALLPAGLAGGLTLLGAALLYAPLLLVSGPAMLFANSYLVALSVGDFWRQLLPYWWQTEGFLAGQRLVGAGATLAVLAAFGGLWGRARAGRLPAGPTRLVRGLGSAAAWFALLPYAVILLQRVQAPERTLLYKAQCWFVLAAVGVDWALRWAAGRGWARRARVGVVAAGLGYALAQVAQLAHYNTQRQQAWRPPRAAFAWLARQPPGPVLVPEPAQRVLLRFYAHSEQVGRPWQLDEHPVPGRRYRYLVRLPGAPAVPGAGAPAFQNEAMVIYVVW